MTVTVALPALAYTQQLLIHNRHLCHFWHLNIQLLNLFEHTIIKFICPGIYFVSIRNSFCTKLRIHSKKIGLFHKCAIISKFRAIFTRNIKKFFRAKISVETPTPK